MIVFFTLSYNATSSNLGSGLNLHNRRLSIFFPQEPPQNKPRHRLDPIFLHHVGCHPRGSIIISYNGTAWCHQIMLGTNFRRLFSGKRFLGDRLFDWKLPIGDCPQCAEDPNSASTSWFRIAEGDLLKPRIWIYLCANDFQCH